MDVKLIKNLIGLFERSALGTLEVSEGEGEKVFSLKLSKSDGRTEVSAVRATERVVASPPATVPADNEPSEGVLDYNKVEAVKSPMVGVFYAQPSPNEPTFVTKGTLVKKGDTLCIIEAMKLMNEVVAERDGKIVEVCVDNGTLVEFGQVLFKIY